MDQNRGGGGLCGRGRRGAGPRGSEQDLESKGEVAARGSEVQAEAWPEFKGDLFRACRGVGEGEVWWGGPEEASSPRRGSTELGPVRRCCVDLSAGPSAAKQRVGSRTE